MKRLGGWWRLWVFLGVLWGIAVVLLTAVNWPSLAEKRWLFDDQIRLLSAQSQKVLSDAQVAVDEEIRQAQLPPLPPGFHLDTPKPLRKGDVVVVPPGKVPWEMKWKVVPSTEVMQNGPEFQMIASFQEVAAFKQDYSRVQDMLLRKARFRVVGFAFLIWLIPCLSVLALGLGFRWVKRGFKKDPS